MNHTAKLTLSLLIPTILLLIPSSWYPIENLTIIEHRFIALFFLAALMWILEPIPVYATSLLIIVLELITCSNKSFILFQVDSANPLSGKPLHYEEIMATFASPIILLFLGGFFLAMAATKYRLDMNIARVILKPFGSNPKYILLGLMIITGTFSMFMSNTATTAMMLAVLTPVLAAFKEDDPGRIAFTLSIPFAANIGGIGTPIGTPPNAIAMNYLQGDLAISFGAWMMFSVPFVLVLLYVMWLMFLLLFPIRAKQIDVSIQSEFLTHWKAVLVYITFIITIFLWLFEEFHGMNSYIVAMIPVAVFSVMQIITKDDLKRISWDVLWLVAGGIALGLGLEKSGLTAHLVQSIPFSSFNPYLIVLLVTMITLTMATFMSHTATANLILPVVFALGTSLPTELATLGGTQMLILSVTFASSLAMALAISTPPNAIAYATGNIQSHQMLKAGLVISMIGMMMNYILMLVLLQLNFFNYM